MTNKKVYHKITALHPEDTMCGRGLEGTRITTDKLTVYLDHGWLTGGSIIHPEDLEFANYNGMCDSDGFTFFYGVKISEEEYE